MLKAHRDAKVFCAPPSLALKMVMSNTKVRSTPPVSELWTSTLTTCSELSDLLISGHAESSSKWFHFVCLFFFWMRLPLVACSVVSLPNGMCGEKKKSPAYWRKFPRLRFSFLVCATGMIDCPGNQDGSSLRSLIDKPPVCGNSFSPLTGALLTGFRLHTGPVLTPHNKHQSCF